MANLLHSQISVQEQTWTGLTAAMRIKDIQMDGTEGYTTRFSRPISALVERARAITISSLVSEVVAI
jgi:hypothetical protein